jgi:UDP-N-acetylglucosamine 2-epimerase (non-hydrolysing)
MSEVFFEQLGLREPDRNLGVGSGTHGVQTARLLEALEGVFVETDPSGIVVYGDVNSTLAATLAAAKLELPIAHVEAGLRSFDRSMPEEVNRVVTDALASLHLTTSPEASQHLANEGVPDESVQFVGNTMIDTLERLRHRLDADPVLDSIGASAPFGLVTLHRPANVDSGPRATAIVEALAEVSRKLPLVFPVHPRGRVALSRAGLFEVESIITTHPLGYLEFMSLMDAARIVFTDSGGVQEETTMLDVPCVTVRPNTERPVTITHGTNRLAEPEAIVEVAWRTLEGDEEPPLSKPPLWDGQAGRRAAALLKEWVEVLPEMERAASAGE